MSESFVAEQDFFVRYAETDAMGVVHHASYIVYLEEARSHYSRERGHSYAEFEKTGYYLVVADLTARFVAPARYGDELVVRCWVKEFKSRSITFGYEILNKGTKTLLVTATTRHICVDHNGTLKRIPKQWQIWVS